MVRGIIRPSFPQGAPDGGKQGLALDEQVWETLLRLGRKDRIRVFFEVENGRDRAKPMRAKVKSPKNPKNKNHASSISGHRLAETKPAASAILTQALLEAHPKKPLALAVIAKPDTGGWRAGRRQPGS